MPRITPDQRAAQVVALVPQLAQAIMAAQAAQDAATAAAGSGAVLQSQALADAQAAWARVADLAGQTQRRSRQLAGLGRGG